MLVLAVYLQDDLQLLDLHSSFDFFNSKASKEVEKSYSDLNFS